MPPVHSHMARSSSGRPLLSAGLTLSRLGLIIRPGPPSGPAVLWNWAATILWAFYGICSFVLALSHSLLRNETRLHILRNLTMSM